MNRIPELQKEKLTEAQRRIYDAILTSRGSVDGPFCIWLYSPEFADRAQSLGEYVRLKSVLKPRISELAILITARFWDCQAEWSIHEEFAKKAGVDKEVIEAIRDRRAPDFRNKDERGVYEFCNQVLKDGVVQDDTFEMFLDQFGEEATVELTGLLGYYGMVAMTLNVFQVPMPEGMEPLLTDCRTHT